MTQMDADIEQELPWMGTVRRETAADLTGAYGWAVYSGVVDPLEDVGRWAKYRYVLGRCWDESLPRIAWVMLNPSTATEDAVDPTITRVVSRSMAAGFGSLEVVNLFALRETSPAVMKQRAEPVGPRNDEQIVRVCLLAEQVVVAWGKDGAHRGRGVAVTEMLQAAGVRLHCLRKNMDGSPEHPLYVPMSKGFETYP